MTCVRMEFVLRELHQFHERLAAFQQQLLWILDPANRLIVDANAASKALLFRHLLMPADCSNQFRRVGASANRAAGTGQLLDGGRADLEEERRCRREAPWRFELRAPLILDVLPIRRIHSQQVCTLAGALSQTRTCARTGSRLGRACWPTATRQNASHEQQITSNSTTYGV